MARTPLVRRPGRAPHEASAGDDVRFRALGLGLLLLRLGPALILLLLVVVVSLTTPIFFTSRNIGNVFSQTAVISVLALGQLLVIVTRGIDLSVGATVALSSVVGAIVFMHVHSGVLVIAAILGVGVAVGAANGVIFVFGRIPHSFIVTLATLSIVRGIALWAAHWTLIPGMPHAVQVLGGGSIGWLPYSFFIVLGLALLGVALTSVVVWGRWLYAVGGNPDAARRTGIPVKKVLVSVYVLSGLTAAVGGLITAGQTDAGSPTFGDLAELDSIAAVIIGGAAHADRERADEGIADVAAPAGEGRAADDDRGDRVELREVAEGRRARVRLPGGDEAADRGRQAAQDVDGHQHLP